MVVLYLILLYPQTDWTPHTPLPYLYHLLRTDEQVWYYEYHHSTPISLHNYMNVVMQYEQCQSSIVATKTSRCKDGSTNYIHTQYSTTYHRTSTYRMVLSSYITTLLLTTTTYKDYHHHIITTLYSSIVLTSLVLPCSTHPQQSMTVRQSGVCSSTQIPSSCSQYSQSTIPQYSLVSMDDYHHSSSMTTMQSQRVV